MTATTEKFANIPDPSAKDDFTLKDIIKTFPKECFEKDRRKAWLAVLLSVSAIIIGYIALATLPWFLLPLTWIWTGTALTGGFVIAHDCGHRSFAQRRWVNDLVGHIFSMPLIYPFHCWRLLHDKHHLHTNKLGFDNAWQPWTPEAYAQCNLMTRLFYRAIRGRFWWIGSIAHWGILHFKLSNFAERDHNKVKISIASVVLFAAICFPTLIITTGVWGFVKFWLMPWMVYHFWMSSFTLTHHTIPEIRFYPAETWNEAKAQLAGTVHCKYPRWFEILCHDISVHIPHHVCVAIPFYRLRMAHESLRENWGEYLHENEFSWALMKELGDKCHLYHPENGYQTFQDI